MINPNEPFSIYIYLCVYIYVKLQDVQTKKHKNHYPGAAPCVAMPRCPLEPNQLLPSVQLHVTNEPCWKPPMSYGDVLW